MCYTIGVNRIGEDANQLEYPGHSKVIDYLGNTMVDCENELGVFIFESKLEYFLYVVESLGLNDSDFLVTSLENPLDSLLSGAVTFFVLEELLSVSFLSTDLVLLNQFTSGFFGAAMLFFLFLCLQIY
jgi:hypothetical protein